MTEHGTIALVFGEEPPAMSISWEEPTGYIVFYADYDPRDHDDDEEAEPDPENVQCLHCLIEGGDEQLGRGLDLARVHGQVDWDPGASEWFDPAAEPERQRVWE